MIAVADVVAAMRRYSLVGMLGWQDVRQRYRRSSLGPFWLTLSMGVMIGTIGIVFGQILKTPMSEYLPFLAIGVIIWGFISTVATEGCMGFIAAEGIIKQLPLPLFVNVARMVWRNILIFAHNMVIVPVLFWVLSKPVGPVALMSIPGFLVLAVNLTWIALVLSVICARFRDLAQIIASILQIAFYLTPIMWMPNLLSGRSGLYLLDLNPVYHLLEIVRSPLLGHPPSLTSWVASLVFALVGWVLALALYGHYKRRIAYWL